MGKASPYATPRKAEALPTAASDVLAYIAKRLLATIPVMAVVAVFVFALLRLTPGDPAAIIAGSAATSQDVANIRLKLGLDEPIVTQFFVWIGNMARGDFGESFFFKRTVASLVADRIEPTLMLSLTTIVLSVAGRRAARRASPRTAQGTWIDRIVMGFSVLGFSVPVFVIGYVLIYVFAIELSWLPVQGYQPLREGLWGCLQRLVLPSVTLSVIYVALIARITRTSVLEVLGRTTSAPRARRAARPRRADAPRLAQRVGADRHGHRHRHRAPDRRRRRHRKRVLDPGLGRLTVDAVLARDYPTVQAVILLFSFVYVLINLLVDVSYTALDPRIRY